MKIGIQRAIANTSLPHPIGQEEQVKCLFKQLQVLHTQILIPRIKHLQDEDSRLTNQVSNVEFKDLFLKQQVLDVKNQDSPQPPTNSLHAKILELENKQDEI